MTEEQKTKELVNEITNFVNSYNDKSKVFNETMSREHRTLQQSFTRLCLNWIEFVSKEEYRTDLRNEGSKNICKELMETFREKKLLEGFTGSTLELMSKPSGYCGHI